MHRHNYTHRKRVATSNKGHIYVCTFVHVTEHCYNSSAPQTGLQSVLVKVENSIQALLHVTMYLQGKFTGVHILHTKHMQNEQKPVS